MLIIPSINQPGVNQHLFSEVKLTFEWEAKRLGKFVKVEPEAELW